MAVQKVASSQRILTGEQSVETPSEFEHPQHIFSRILVAVDGSEFSKRASMLALRMAKRDASELIFVNIVSAANRPLVDPMLAGGIDSIQRDYSHEMVKAADDLVRRNVDIAKAQNVRAGGEVMTVAGPVADALVEYAVGEKADLIVIGTRGMSGLKRLVIGSVSSGVVAHAHCPVLVVR